MKIMRKAKEEKGAITLFVLISMLFFVIVLVGIYIGTSHRTQKQQNEIEKIQKEYETTDIDELYNMVYESISEVEDEDGIFVCFKGDTLSFYSKENDEIKVEEYYYGNIKKRTFERIGDEEVGELHIPWKDKLNDIKRVNIVEEIEPIDMSFYFAELRNCGEINGLDKIITDNVKSMKGLFHWCGINNSNLTTIDISNFNTSNVTNMAYMFDRCRKVKNIILPENFDTTKVINMRSMFNNLQLVSNLDLSKLDTRNVTDMFGMFYENRLLTEINFPDTFNTSKVTNMSYMFANCINLNKLDISKFDTENVTDMSYMFSRCTTLSDIELSNLTTNKVMNMEYMFNECSNISNLNLSNFNTENVTDMKYMFNVCSNLSNLDISKFNTENVTDMKFMFNTCTNLVSLNLSNFNTSKVTNMQEMFSSCQKLENLVIDFDISNVDDFTHMFLYVPNTVGIVTNENMKKWLSENYPNFTNVLV